MSDYNEHLISMAGGDGGAFDAIQRRVDKATPGPWFREYGDVITAHPDPRDVEEGYEDPRDARVVRGAPHLPKKDRQGIADADFIANARTDIPTLLELAQDQQNKLDRIIELAHWAGKRGWTIHPAEIRTALEAS